MSKEEFQKCAEACMACSLACDYCAGALLKSEHIEKLRDCITILFECSAICKATVTVMTLEGSFSEQQCRLCIDVCNNCADVCEANMQWSTDDCRTCADVCRRCADICEETFNAIGKPVLSGSKQRSA